MYSVDVLRRFTGCHVHIFNIVTLVMIDTCMYICMWSPAGNMLIQLNRRLAT